jgi:DNA-binding NtrC family response regulator
LLQATVTAFVNHCAELAAEAPSALLLLDVDLLPADAQGALIGFLDIREFELRTVATARTPPLVLAGRDEFRSDLACALSTLVIEIPALADRTEDIPMLAQLFLEEKNAGGGRQVGGFTSEAMDLLLAYSWPGNVEELKATVDTAHRRTDGPLVTVTDLPERLTLASEAASYPASRDESISMDDFLRDTEVELITRALGRAKGNKAKASRLLGISRARLLRRLSQLGLADE